MKKLLIILIVIFTASGIYSNDFMKFINNKNTLEFPKYNGRPYFSSRETPDYEFITEPAEIMINYYDYMPGSYCGTPIQIEEDGSAYIVFHARETENSTRRIYCAYITPTGFIPYVATIGTEDIHEGYPGMDLDPVTGDPIVAWHANYDTQTTDLEVVCSNDLYHTGNLGLWREPFIVISDTLSTPNVPDDEFIWPYVHIGPSPDPDKRRVYIFANNNDCNPYTGNPCENVLIIYADFDETDLDDLSELEWNYRTIMQLDVLHNITESIRPYLSPCVSDDGKIALMGYLHNYDTNERTLLTLLNENYGEGNFNSYSYDAHFDVWAPGVQLGWYFFAPENCNHQNSIFYNGNAKISFLGNMQLMYGDGNYFEEENFCFPKILSFDLTSQAFSFYDLYVEGADPSDDMVMVPWDINEDGIVDTNAYGQVTYVEGWPFASEETPYFDNNFKIIKNEDNGWLAAIWCDGLNARKAFQGFPGYAQWEDTPEIAICISSDFGESWSQPIFLNSIETSEFLDIKPNYVYPGDIIEDIGNNHGKLHLFFVNEGGFLPSDAGVQMYCSLDIDFSPFVSMQPETIPQPEIYLTNYPNPFNPTTTISFSVPQNAMSGSDGSSFVILSIYNIKGQKMKTLVSDQLFAGEHSVVWDGRDTNDRQVASGVYFYKMEAGRFEKVKKMILIK
jgi:hypothetical protein